jgi:hypothetical protein
MTLRNGGLVFCCGALAMLAGTAMGQENANAEEQVHAHPRGDGPRITFDRMSYDFGVIDDGKVVDTAFKFTNTGNAPLDITDSKGSCSCTAPKLERTTYQPGESGVIRVTYNPHGRRGLQHTKVTVASNDASRPSVTLELQADIKPQLMLDPSIANIGEMPMGKGSTISVAITSRCKRLMPMQATPSLASLASTLGETQEVLENGEMVWKTPVEISLLPTAGVGQMSGQITVRTNDPDRTFNIPVIGAVLGDIDARPARVQLNAVAPNAPLSTQIRLSSRRGQAFKVLKVEEAARGPVVLKLDFTEDGAAWVVEVAGVAPQAGSFHGEIVVTTDLPSENTMKIPYFGFARQAGSAQAAKPFATSPTGVASPWDKWPSALDPRSFVLPGPDGSDGC